MLEGREGGLGGVIVAEDERLITAHRADTGASIAMRTLDQPAEGGVSVADGTVFAVSGIFVSLSIRSRVRR